MSINPPKGTKYGTKHVLRNVLDSSEKVWEWNRGRKGDGWFSPGTGFGTTTNGMRLAGWQYARAEDSDNG